LGKSKHQTATQNITADMIEGIGLLTNLLLVLCRLVVAKKKGIALNLKPKIVMHKWVTDFELHGLNNLFRFHSNAFQISFAKS
jgi:hypothetical protein